MELSSVPDAEIGSLGCDFLVAIIVWAVKQASGTEGVDGRVFIFRKASGCVRRGGLANVVLLCDANVL